MLDARAMQAEAVALLDAGDWRDAAEKGWFAIRNATAALVLGMTGGYNPHNTSINAGIHKLARERGGEWLRLRESYTDVVYNLHGERFMGVSTMMIFPIWCAAWPITFVAPWNWPGSGVNKRGAENQSDIQ